MDRTDEIPPLIGAIAHLAESRDGRLTKIRLVKFLYLLDLYAVQAGGSPVTRWPWAFVHYGPYCRESTDAIDAAEKYGFLVADAYESRFRDEDFKLYRTGPKATEDQSQSVLSRLPLHVNSSLNAAVRRWHDDTYDLLDHVYFHTAPMRGAKPGQILSFTNVKMPDYAALRPVRMLPLSEKKKAKVRELIAKLPEPQPVPQPNPALYDDVYESFVKGMSGSQTPPGWGGIAELDFGEPEDD